MVSAQILTIVLYAVSLLVVASKHGQPREGKYNIWASLIATGIVFTLLITGGFFN